VFFWAMAKPETMSKGIVTKIMIAFPIINSQLGKIFGHEFVNLNSEHPFSSAVNDASTL
jgi:hypothetical protein